MLGLCCSVRGSILGKDRKLCAQRSARALFGGHWIRNTKVINFPNLKVILFYFPIHKKL